jgi:hypothetical protein
VVAGLVSGGVNDYFRVAVYDHDPSGFKLHGRADTYVSAKFEPLMNDVGSWSMTFDVTNNAVGILAQAGRRIVVDYRPSSTESWHRLMSGPVQGVRQTEETPDQQIEVFGFDDLVKLKSRVIFQQPGVVAANDTPFTMTPDFDIRTGNGETVIKGYVTANAVTRLAIPGLSVATNLNRGATVKGSARCDPLFDIVTKLAADAGLVLTIAQVSGGLVFDAFEPPTQPVRLSKKLGNLKAWDYVFEAPGATRAVVGGRGEGTARRYVKTTLASSETDWGINEQFLDASDLDLDADLSPKGQEFLALNAPTAGFSLTPEDTAAMAFGRDYGIGSKVMVELPGGVQQTETVTRVTLTHEEAGLTVEPGVGARESTDKDTALYRQLDELRAQIARLERRP